MTNSYDSGRDVYNYDYRKSRAPARDATLVTPSDEMTENGDRQKAGDNQRGSNATQLPPKLSDFGVFCSARCSIKLGISESGAQDFALLA
jgi:hypothetical protein